MLWSQYKTLHSVTEHYGVLRDVTEVYGSVVDGIALRSCYITLWNCYGKYMAQKCTSPLHALAVQCSLQTSPITQPMVRYIHTTSVP